jgi:uncharacterized membrane protein
MNEWLNVAFRWIHVLAGITWIGHLYFFNFVNAQVAKTYDADSKKKVVPELMPRALYWFRWGAAWTWVTGILLLGIVYYGGGALLEATSTMSVATGSIIGLVLLVVGFAVYDALWKSPLGKQPMAGTIVSLVLLAAVAWWLSTIFSGRAMFIHLGALLGTIMAANVWMRIWPAQQKIITAIRDGQAPEAALVAMAGQRSRHNTYMSVPLVWAMINSHTAVPYASSPVYLFVIILIGWGATYLLYKNVPRVKGF